MSLYDDSGNPVDIPVTEPGEVPSRLATLPSALESVVPPALISSGAGWGTEAGLAALGITNPWLTVPAAIGAAGASNVASSKLLPPEYGGQPQASALSDFLWGAAPEALSLGGRGLAARLAERRLSHAGASFMEQGRRELLDPENLRVQETLLTPPAPLPFAETPDSGPARTLQANEARGPIINAIHAMRQKYGAPIGEAYRALKGEEPIEADEAGSLATAAEHVQASMISPGPLTQRYATLLQSFGKRPDLGIEHRDIELPGGDWIRHAPAPQKPPPTLDQLRNLRQQINLDLQKAKGGDRYGLGMLQDVLDNRLMDHLPANMDEMRMKYRGMIHRWGYERERAIANMSDPSEIVNHLFEKPRDAAELAAENPNAQGAIRERFVQYVWGDLPDEAPAAKRADIIRRRLAPYVRDPKIARAMLGNKPAARMSEMVAWGRYAPDLDQQLRKNPKTRAAFQQAFNEYFRQQKMNPADATVAAMQRLMQSLPGVSSMPESLLPSTAGRHPQFSNVLAGRHGAMTGLALAMARPEAALYQAAMAVSWLAHSNGFTASSKLGITRSLLGAFKATNPLRAGWLFARSMDLAAHGGAQTIRQAEPVEMDNAP